tara:strand:+ start:523 stop:792 length:270 start_codon:yes stop_codon:yes gene_type:complete
MNTNSGFEKVRTEYRGSKRPQGGFSFGLSEPDSREKKFSCPRGHTFTTDSPIVIAVAEEPEYNTGPICSYCYVNWFKANVNASEVLDDT